MHIEATSGLLLILVTALALIAANSSFSDSYFAFWDNKIGFTFFNFSFYLTVKQWINDGLMTAFFFVVGMEVKREIVHGSLGNVRQAMLPVLAALGGMVIPALIYVAIAHNSDYVNGWGIPMTTDIAFVVGCLAILGRKVPSALRILLLTLAIADDIGAIIVIALAYSSGIDTHALILAALGMGLGYGLIRLGVKNVAIYLAVAGFVWFYFHESGIHPTIAGVIFGLAIPANPSVENRRFKLALRSVQRSTTLDRWASYEEKKKRMKNVARAARSSVSPIERLIDDLHPWVAFFIMPIFAFANAGVMFSGGIPSYTVATGIFVGLIIGKPVGITLFSWLAVKLKITSLPDDLNWPTVFFGSTLTGIGFTMALFISGLAFTGPVLASAKVGVLLASGISAAVGMTGLGIYLSRKRASSAT